VVHVNATPEFGSYKEKEELDSLQATVVQVRPYTGSDSIDWLRKQSDCPNGERFFDVKLPRQTELAVACEHEVLTD
jgi:hypothetical protein